MADVCIDKVLLECSSTEVNSLSDSESMASSPPDPEKKNPWVQMANYAQLAVVFPAATVVGWLIGAALDRWLHTSWLYIVGLILGIIAGFVELIRTAMKDSS